jgi:two-component system OmpR family sensor kinase
VSLRARLLAGLLVLVAAGLVTVAAVTYAEQRSFLYQRVDQQIVAARDTVSRTLDQSGANVPGYAPPPGGFGPFGGPGGGNHGPRPNGDFPGYAVGLRRDANGKQVGKPAVVTRSPERLAMPRFPAELAMNHTVTVGSVGSSLQYRVTAFQTRDQPGTTLVAVPLRSVTQTLHRLLLVSGLVIGAVLLALAALAWWVVGLGLRPLDRMGATAGAIAKGDLSRRVSPASDRTEVGRLGLALNGMLAQIEKAFAERAASENRLRRFLADASHELRTPLSSSRTPRRRCAASRRRRAEWACSWRTYSCSRAWTSCVSPCGSRWSCATSPATRWTTHARWRPTGRSSCRRTAPRSCWATATSCARSWPT